MISGVAKVPTPGDKTIFASHQQKLQSLKWKISAKMRKK